MSYILRILDVELPRGLAAFAEQHRPRLALLVCMEKTERLVDGIRIVPWKLFLDRLWSGEIVN